MILDNGDLSILDFLDELAGEDNRLVPALHLKDTAMAVGCIVRCEA